MRQTRQNRYGTVTVLPAFSRRPAKRGGVRGCRPDKRGGVTPPAKRSYTNSQVKLSMILPTAMDN